MQSIYTNNFGDEWLTDDCLTCGDYVGAGSVGVANLRWLERNAGIIEIDNAYRVIYSEDNIKFTPNIVDFSAMIICGAHHSKRAFIRLTGEQADAKLIEATRKLEDHPCYEDELVSQVESEWEEFAWDNGVRSALCSNTHIKLFTYIEERVFPFDFPAADAFYYECYREAMESHNEYPIPEYAGVTIRVEIIADTFTHLVMDKLRERNRARKYAWRKNWLCLPTLKKNQTRMEV